MESVSDVGSLAPRSTRLSPDESDGRGGPGLSALSSSRNLKGAKEPQHVSGGFFLSLPEQEHRTHRPLFSWVGFSVPHLKTPRGEGALPAREDAPILCFRIGK